MICPADGFVADYIKSEKAASEYKVCAVRSEGQIDYDGIVMNIIHQLCDQ